MTQKNTFIHKTKFEIEI